MAEIHAALRRLGDWAAKATIYPSTHDISQGSTTVTAVCLVSSIREENENIVVTMMK